MPHYNILISCDQKYYSDWGKILLETTYVKNPWLKDHLHCHIVNPSSFEKLPYVNYTTEIKEFTSDESKISYLQSSRFLTVAEKITKDNFFITLDADTICARSFSQEDFAKLFNEINVLKHHKADRWLAGFVTFNSVDFATEYRNLLMSTPVDQWTVGRDQDVLDILSKKYNFKQLDYSWMSYGKSLKNCAFYTLKGDQKISKKFLTLYDKFLL